MPRQLNLLLVFLLIFGLLLVYVEYRISLMGQRLTKQPLSGLDNLETPVIFYNRVPKTGSSSFMGLCHKLTKENAFHTVHLNVSKNAHTLTLRDQMSFARNVTLWHQRHPGLFHGHLAFFDFATFGYRRPIYVNVIRDPLERFVSYYYFLR